MTSVDQRIKYKESFLNDLVETMFTSLLLHFTGRTKPYNAYAKTMKKARIVPSIVDLDVFLSSWSRQYNETRVIYPSG